MEFIKENIGLILFVLFMLALVWLFVRACKKDSTDKKRLLEELEQPYVEPQSFEYKAIVVEKYIERKNFGSARMPNTKECCYVVFKTQDSKLWEYEASIEEYTQLQEDEAVIIAVADGKVIGFYIDEE